MLAQEAVTATVDWRLAEALAIHKLHGKCAALWVAERRGMLILAGDTAGVERMSEIAAKLDGILAAQQRPS